MPPTVSDLSVVGSTDAGITLSWTEVEDGRNQPASYSIRYMVTPMGDGWGEATEVVEGECASPVPGSQVGATALCTVSDLAPSTSYDFRLIAFREQGNHRVYSEELSNVATGVTLAADTATSDSTDTGSTDSDSTDTGGTDSDTTTTTPPPTTVTDLRVAATTESSAELSWTDVDDGEGQAATYEIRYALTPIGDGWGEAVQVETGDCTAPIYGSSIGGTKSCTITGLNAGTGYDFQMVSFREESDGRIYSEGLSNVVTATTDVPEDTTTTSAPSTVQDLEVVDHTLTSVTLAWTDVDDGTGAAASYQVRYALSPIGWGWGDATVVVSGDCASPIQGQSVGTRRTCTVGGLLSSTTYDFQMASFRDEADGRVYAEGLSNVATASTADDTGDGGSDDGGSTDDGDTGGSAAWPNQPAGHSAVTERAFDAANENGWYTGNLNGRFDIVSDAAAPRSPSSVGQATFPAGMGDGVSPIYSETSIESQGLTEVYVSFWVKISDNWKGHSSLVNKIGFVWIHDNPVVFPTILGSGYGSLTSQIRLQNTPDGAINLSSNVSDPAIQRGQWHRMEMVLKSNTGSNADGEVHWWVDGQKVGAHTNVRFGSSAQSDIWQIVAWRPVWGGRGDVLEVDQHMWMDHFYVSGR